MDQAENKNSLQLPLAVASRVDIGRLMRELEALDNFLKAAQAREPGNSIQLPKTSKLFDELLEINKLNALKDEDREKIGELLKDMRSHAPTIHMSFSADPSPLFTKRLITWLRQNIHPNILLQVGMQPNIGAGAVVRTTNKYFDFSLRQKFSESTDVLMRTMRHALKTDGSEQTVESLPADEAAQPEQEAIV